MAWTFTVGAVSASFDPQADDNRKLSPTRAVRSETNMYIGGTSGRVDVFGYGPRVFKGGSFDVRCATADALKLLNPSQLLGQFGTLSDGTTSYDATLTGVNLQELLTTGTTGYEYSGTLEFLSI